MPQEEFEEEPELVSDITDIEIIAVNTSIHILEQLRKRYGGDRWRKLKGKAYVIDDHGQVILAEVHWYECHGIGRRRMKVKFPMEG